MMAQRAFHLSTELFRCKTVTLNTQCGTAPKSSSKLQQKIKMIGDAQTVDDAIKDIEHKWDNMIETNEYPQHNALPTHQNRKSDSRKYCTPFQTHTQL